MNHGIQSLPVDPHSLAQDPPGERVGTYIKTQKLGEGGMGEVWKAWDTKLQRWVALKLVKRADADEAARFRREALTAARLNHPNIAAVYEATDAWIAMQLIDGATLAVHPRNNPRELVDLVRQAAEAVHFAHRAGVIHRDLKPQNLMIQSGHLYVLDFGLARSTHVKSSFSVSGFIAGTPDYMSPEQARGRSDVDARADVWALGATLYELLADRPPFQEANLYSLLLKVIEDEPKPLRAIRPTIDAELDTIVGKCLQKEPAQRYATAANLAADLKRWLDGEPILAHAPSITYRLRKSLSKRKAVLAMALVGLGLTAGVALFVIPRWLQAVEDRRLAETARITAETAKRTKDAEVLAEKERQLATRRLLEEGRVFLADAGRLLATENWTPDQLKTLIAGARAKFEAAAAASPSDPEPPDYLGRVALVAGNTAAALDHFSRSIDLGAAYATPYLERALLLADSYERQRHLSEGPGTKPETDEMRTLRDRANADLAKVREFSQDRRELILAEGVLALADADYPRATDRFEEFVRLAPTDYRGYAHLSHVYSHVKGREQETIRACTEALRLRTDLTHLILRRLRSRIDLREYDAAMADIALALEKVPSRRDDVIAERGHLHFVQRRWKEADADFTESLSLGKKSGPLYYNRGCCRLALGRVLEGADDFIEATAFYSHSAAYSRLGDIYRAARIDQREALVQDWMKRVRFPFYLFVTIKTIKAAEAKPGDLESWLPDVRQARKLMQAGKTDEARELFADALDRLYQSRDIEWVVCEPPLATEIGTAHASLGACLAIKGDAAGAIEQICRAVDVGVSDLAPLSKLTAFDALRETDAWKDVVNRLARPRAVFGASMTEEPEGVRVSAVMADTPAARAGIVKGDIILAADAWKVRGAKTLQFALRRAARHGEGAAVTVQRDGKEVVLHLVFAPRE